MAITQNYVHPQAQQKNGKQTYKERLEPLRDKRVVFIFDECHRSQFGENHKAIKEFFPKAQLFGFTGTPIFDENSSYQQVDGNLASFKTTEDIFEKELHAYTITHAIEDKNVLSFHIDYFGKDDGKGGQTKPKKKELPPPEAVVKAILDKHDSATNKRRFNAILATESINHAIEYFELFKIRQAQKQIEDENFEPLNIACVFSPPAQAAKDGEGNSTNGTKNAADIKQLQEDLPQESADNQVEPEKKKAALMAIIADYNGQYGTNHTINEFDLYYQDVQQRIKDQKYSNTDYPRKNKIDITIVVDMLLTGFDSKYLNTLYVDKSLKHHGLIQAFSRTNRVLNDTKPWGNILDFRYQENEVDAAIELFSGSAKDKAREIWLVDPASKVVEAFQKKVDELQTFMESKGLTCEPSEVHNLKGDTAKAEFINHFKEVQKLKTQLEQYTDLDEESKAIIEQKLPTDTLRGFKAIYLDTAMELKRKQGKSDDNEESVEQLEFDLVLFASSIIDYDYIMGLIAKSTQKTGKQKNDAPGADRPDQRQC
ncbi:DEAD/DEAH box helicase family protein [Dickeya chrysanthemi]|uniref:type I restriction endonuclease subunit R, EcoR124 family n=1 Tax=Dickeya chrysanthemi TaxID=556 RepID=UPI0034A0D2F1